MSAATEHARKTEATVERAPHVPRRMFVIDCACGWQSPLCSSLERADKLYDDHKRRTRARQRKSPAAE